MANSIKNGKVVYVEPNVANDFTMYQSYMGDVPKSVDLEDMCIVVGLQVEVKGRTYGTSTGANSQNVTRMVWQSAHSGEKVSFMQGTKIPTTNHGDIYSLTTNYTDIHLYDIQNDGTMEMFGIKSIDISYDNFMVPEVTIQFVDVRGVSVFAQEEMRHNLSRGSMNGIANEDVEGSFFKCFFTFPYPKFTLYVKGFYGQMVSYELTCTDFRAAFDSNTGNFNVTARFIGYAFSFLNDIMVNSLVSAPYSEYLGKEYWQRQIEQERFVLYDKNGYKKVAMQTLGYICSQYREIQEKVSEEIGRNGYAEMARQLSLTDEEQQTLQDADIQDLRKQYNALISQLETIGNNVQATGSANGDSFIRPNMSNSCCIVVDGGDNVKALEDLMPSFKTVQELIKTSAEKFDELRKWNQRHQVQLLEYTSIEDVDFNSLNNDDDDLVPAIENKESEKMPGKEDTTYGQMWVDGDDSEVFIYQDFKLGQLLGNETNIAANNEKTVTALKKKIEATMLDKMFADAFGFEPTVENVTRIIMAHVETLIYMISKCSENIIGAGDNRSVANLGISPDQFPDIGRNDAIPATSDTIVDPFPKVTHLINHDGISKYEDEWLGDVQGLSGDNMEEIKLIEGLLNGAAEAAHDINKANQSFMWGGTEERTAIKYPLSFFDLFINKDTDNIWGNITKLDDVNELFARFCVRAFAVMGTQTWSSIDKSVYGQIDAENFIAQFEGRKEIETLGKMIRSITFDKVLSFLKEGMSSPLDGSKKSKPWFGSNSLITEVGERGKVGQYQLTIGKYGQKDNVIPLKNWNFAKIGTIVNPSNGKLISKNFNNDYVTTSNKDGEAHGQASIIDIREAPVQYFKNSIYALKNSTFASSNPTLIDDIFTDAKSFEFDGWGDEYSNDSVYYPVFFNEEGTHVTVNEAISYDKDGKALRNGKFSVDLKDLFLTYEFTDKEVSMYNKAVMFIKAVFPQRQCMAIDMISQVQGKARFKYYPKYVVLRDAIFFLENEKIDGIKEDLPVRLAIKQKYIQYLADWIKSKFSKVYSDFTLGVRPDVGLSGLRDTVAQAVKDKKNVRDEMAKCFTNEGWTKFGIEYDFKAESGRYTYLTISGKQMRCDTGGLRLTTKPCPAMSDLLEDLGTVVGVTLMTKFNLPEMEYNGATSINPYLPQTALEQYFSGFISVLSEKMALNPDGTVASPSISQNNDPADIKVGVYNYIKLLYDKWIASDTQGDFYKMETLFEGGNPTFQFIDSVYTKIGDTMYLNLSTLVDRVYQSQTRNGYTLLSMMSGLYADNKFLFLCIQNFMDLANVDMMDQMFKPVSYLDKKEPSNHPNFVVLMPYEPSSKLDVEGADFPDDTFYLNDEASWPEMINGKPEGNPIPAFGVTYGQQYQNYFQNIQVDMNAPMVTEQSIKAKFMISGVGDGTDNNGPKGFTAGQDLYTIYSNNSYTCTVTMLGCAWVQPMMYFVLQNVPMFRGSYMIVKVNHQIQPGYMTTTFKGVRMAKTATRTVKHPMFNGIEDSTAMAGWSPGEGSLSRSAVYANIGNDCEYAYYDPLGRTTGTMDRTQQMAYCNAVYKMLTSDELGDQTALSEACAKGICANIMAESTFNPFVLTVDCNQDGTKHGPGGGLGGFFGATVDYEMGLLFRYTYGEDLGRQKFDELSSKVQPIWDEASGITKCDVRKNACAAKGYTLEVPFESQVKFIHQAAFRNDGPYITFRGSSTPSQAAWNWMVAFEKPAAKYRTNRWDKYGQFVEQAIQSDAKISVTTQDDEVSGNTTDRLAEGIRKSLEDSLRSSQSYNQVEVKLKKINVDNYEYTATGKPNANNALFDCMLNTYSQWFNRIYWNIGSTKASNDVVSVVIDVVESAGQIKSITIEGEKETFQPLAVKTAFNVKTFQTMRISKKEELNESLKLSLIKYFKNNGVNTPEAAKSVFKSCNFSDDMTKEVFELSGDTKSINDCDSVMGDYTVRVGDYVQPSIQWDLGKSITSIGHYDYSESQHVCARAVREALEAGGLNLGGHPRWAYKYIEYLPSIGFKYLGRFQNLDSSYTPQKGDIAVYMKNGNPNEPGHICIYNGIQWRSDFKQKNMIVYTGTKVAYVFRYGGVIAGS